jgi:hypothetical protein
VPVLRQAVAARIQAAERTVDGLWRLARHPRQSLGDARTSADILRDLCEGGLVVSTAFPTAAQVAAVAAAPAAGASALVAILADASARGAAAGDAEPIALRTVLQADGDLALLIDQGLAAGDQRVLRALLRVHAGAVRAALTPLVRAQAIAAALRASVRVAAPAFGLAGGAAAHWLSGLVDALVWGAVSATASGSLLIALRWALETYIRRKARKLFAG